jgi:hypothetical protein
MVSVENSGDLPASPAVSPPATSFSFHLGGQATGKALKHGRKALRRSTRAAAAAVAIEQAVVSKSTVVAVGVDKPGDCYHLDKGKLWGDPPAYYMVFCGSERKHINGPEKEHVGWVNITTGEAVNTVQPPQPVGFWGEHDADTQSQLRRSAGLDATSSTVYFGRVQLEPPEPWFEPEPEPEPEAVPVLCGWWTVDAPRFSKGKLSLEEAPRCSGSEGVPGPMMLQNTLSQQGANSFCVDEFRLADYMNGGKTRREEQLAAAATAAAAEAERVQAERIQREKTDAEAKAALAAQVAAEAEAEAVAEAEAMVAAEERQRQELTSESIYKRWLCFQPQPLPLHDNRPEALTFSKSNFRTAYLASEAPEGPWEVGGLISKILELYCERHHVHWAPDGKSFLKKLQKQAMEHAPDFSNGVGRTSVALNRLWTAHYRLRGKEFCSILNACLRLDDPMLSRSIAELARGINQMNVTAAGHSPPHHRCYRGGGFDESLVLPQGLRHRDWWTAGKMFRQPAFLATSPDASVANQFIVRSTELAKIRWVFIFHPQRACRHVNMVGQSHVPSEKEFLFSPFSVFTVYKVSWSESASNADPHVIELLVSCDNQSESEDLPLAPWS